VRNPRLSLTTVARVRAGGALPATGWTERFDGVDGRLHLPPGHRLIAAIGADSAPGSWFERWGLWSVFGVFVVVAFVYWTAGLVPAAIAAFAFLLTYQEAPSYIWLWGNLLAALAVARAAPEGRFRRLAHGFRTTSFVLLALALLPFMWMQVRLALYPQLENQGYLPMLAQAGSTAPIAAEATMMEDATAMSADAAAASADGAEMAAPAPAPAPPPPVERMKRSDGPGESSVANPYGLNSLNVVQRYASGTRLQAGPGIPAWQYNSYDYHWSGPVEPTDTVRFVYSRR
jgi:hypothetical protein